MVGWSIDSSPTGKLVTNALGMAIDSRLDKHSEPGTIIHSDQGVQFGSWAFTKRAKDSGLLASMGSIGDCYDNSMIESFWSRMQVELLDRKKWNTRLDLANAIFEYLEIWHNRRRRHSQLGWLAPIVSKAIASSPWHEIQRILTAWNPGHTKVSGDPGAVQFVACGLVRRRSGSASNLPLAADDDVWSVRWSRLTTRPRAGGRRGRGVVGDEEAADGECFAYDVLQIGRRHSPPFEAALLLYSTVPPNG